MSNDMLCLILYFLGVVSALQLKPGIADISTVSFEQLYQQKTLDLNNIVELKESIPVKDSLTYDSVIGYEFNHDLDSSLNHLNQLVILLSGSVCQLPEFWNTSASMNGLKLYYTFNETIAENLEYEKMDSTEFENGFISVLIEKQNVNLTSAYPLYMIIAADHCEACTENSLWVFELAVSQSNLFFLYDNEPRISVVDVDYDSVIFQASSSIFGTNQSYELYIFNNLTAIPTALNQSICAISESKEFERIVPINDSFTRFLDHSFILNDFDIDTTYQGILTVTNPNITYAGGVFQPFEFTTSKTQSCKLVYGLEFCDEVAYAAPISDALLQGEQTWNEFLAAYDNNTESLYKPFLYALQQVACDTELDARYSPIRTCDNCRYSYKQWLCAVTIPRCVSYADGGFYNKKYEAGSGRNSFLENEIQPPLPYAEILPCLNVCQAIVRDCPSDFGFGCPETSSLIKLSYIDPAILSEEGIGETSSTVNAASAEETYRLCNHLGVQNTIVGH